MEKEKILVVDDEKEIRDLVGIYLKNEGYEILMAEDGVKALDILNNNKIDLIILDVMMPNMNGIDTCIKVREQNNIPIIMLSAKSEDMDKIFGLTSGADDYLSKPFNPLELTARVKSQLRRYKVLNNFKNDAPDTNTIIIDDLIIDIDQHKLTKNGENIKLTPTEFSILKLLAKNKGKVFSTEKIYELVWNETFFNDCDNTVMVHIRKLREKIEDNSRSPVYIKTVWGVGYKMKEK